MKIFGIQENVKLAIIFIPIFLYFLLFPFFLQAQNIVQLTNLRTEYKLNPMGISTAYPRFSWEIASSERDVRQTAWHIRAAASEDDLKTGQNLL